MCLCVCVRARRRICPVCVCVCVRFGFVYIKISSSLMDKHKPLNNCLRKYADVEYICMNVFGGGSVAGWAGVVRWLLVAAGVCMRDNALAGVV